MRLVLGKTAPLLLVVLVILALAGFSGPSAVALREQTPAGITVVSFAHALPLPRVVEAVTKEHSWEQARVT